MNSPPRLWRNHIHRWGCHWSKLNFKCGRTENSTGWVWKRCPRMASWNSVSRNVGAWIGNRSFYLDGVGYLKRPRQECASHKGGHEILWRGIELLHKVMHHGPWEQHPQRFWGVTCRSTQWPWLGADPSRCFLTGHRYQAAPPHQGWLSLFMASRASANSTHPVTQFLGFTFLSF